MLDFGLRQVLIRPETNLVLVVGLGRPSQDHLVVQKLHLWRLLGEARSDGRSDSFGVEELCPFLLLLPVSMKFLDVSGCFVFRDLELTQLRVGDVLELLGVSHVKVDLIGVVAKVLHLTHCY